VSRPARWWLAAAVLAAVVSLLLLQVGRAPAAVDVLETRARALAAEGRGQEAAAALRHAAELLEPEQAAHVLRIAAELENR
jgi:hypothetical protein